MKRLLLTLLVLLMLAGCNTQPGQPTDPTAPPTEPQSTTPWVEELGMPWDAAGVLKEVPLTIPDGLHYSAAMEFDGDLLMWSLDDHLKDQKKLEMILVELDDGSVAAQQELGIVGYVYPQCLGGTLYICDGAGGTVTALDKNLEISAQWETAPTENTMLMGADGILYSMTDEESLIRTDLNTGESAPLLEGDPNVGWISDDESTMMIRYYRPENGQESYCVLDLLTGELVYAEADHRTDSVARMCDTWLYENYGESYIYYLHESNGNQWRMDMGMTNLKLLEDGYIMATDMEAMEVSLYHLDGTLVSVAQISEDGLGYFSSALIWNENNNGFFFMFRSYDETSRLLFWDIEKSIEGGDLPLEPVAAPDEAQAKLEARARELGDKYGVIILVGEQCDTVFDEFTAAHVTDYDQVNDALNVLERALEAYPASFIRQLRYGDVQSIQIHLIRDLQADGSGRSGGGYSAFAQSSWNYSIIVADIEETSEQTYYHEFSHLIDVYLEWDAQNRSDALYSEDAWAGLNPGWFGGYSEDYSKEHDLWDGESFLDGYSTIRSTEDRARVLEHAMADYDDYNFRKGTVLYKKLDYYCRCIRNAFDTTDWAEAPLWERFL